MSDTTRNLPPVHPPTRKGICPSCGRRSRFRFEGEQRWPRHIAEKAGLPMIILLWSCGYCHSTVSDNEIV